MYRVWYLNRNRKSDGSYISADDYYENATCDFVFLTEFITLPDGDVLIGMQHLDDDMENKRYPSLEYHKLSDIRLSYNEMDNTELWAHEDEYDYSDE